MSSFELYGQLMPHGHCILWSHPLIEILVLSNGLISLSYFFIPFFLFKIWKQSKSTLKLASEDLSVLIWAIGFIILCGLTHLCSIFTMYIPAWWTQSAIDSAAAVVSIIAVFEVAKFVKRVSSFPSLEDFNKMKKERDVALKALEDKKELKVVL